MTQSTALTPKLRFPEFRNAPDWEERRVKDVCELNPSNCELPETFFYIDLESVERGHLRAKTLLNKSEAPSRAQRLLEVGDVIFQIVRPYQRNNLFFNLRDSHPFVASTGYAQLRAHECESFLYHAIHTDPFVSRVMAQCTGSSYPAINSSDLAEIPLATPSPAEQQKIAECLSTLDELIGAESQKLDALKAHKKGLMQQLFPREGETLPRLRFPEFHSAPEWQLNELGELADVRDGTHDSPKFYSTGWPLVTSKNLLSDGTLDLDNVSLISAEDYAAINKRSKVSVGDILFGMIGTIGNPVLIRSEGFAIKNVALIKELGPLSNRFLVQLLQSPFAAGAFSVLSTGNSQKFVALGKIRSLSIPVPALPEQHRIATCLSSLDELIAAQSDRLSALQTHKQGLLQGLFPVRTGSEK